MTCWPCDVALPKVSSSTVLWEAPCLGCQSPGQCHTRWSTGLLLQAVLFLHYVDRKKMTTKAPMMSRKRRMMATMSPPMRRKKCLWKMMLIMSRHPPMMRKLCRTPSCLPSLSPTPTPCTLVSAAPWPSSPGSSKPSSALECGGLMPGAEIWAPISSQFLNGYVALDK